MAFKNLKRAVCATACICAALLVSGQAGSQSYPSKPIRIVVPFSPGGGNDAMARLVGVKLTESLGQQVVVENRPGAAGAIASETVAAAPADGYTIYLVSTSFTAAPSLVRKLPFDTEKDFAPVTRLGVVPAALITHASLPVSSAKELIALARAKPGQVTFGSAGIGSGSHLGGELFKMLAGVDMLHVPYKGSAIVTTALLSGEVMMALSDPISSMPHVKAGRLKNLGVTTAERWPLLPDYPTLAESGLPGYENVIWNGIVVRQGTPAAIIERLHGEFVEAVKSPQVVSSLAAAGTRAMVTRPDEFGSFIRNEIAKWRKVTAAAGIRPN